MLRSKGLRLGICGAALALIIASFISTSTEARRGGGGGGGGGRGISRGGGGGHIGRSVHSGSAMRSLSGVRSASRVRSLPTTRTDSKTLASQSLTSPKVDRSAGSTPTGALRTGALRNDAFASLSTHNPKDRALARATFRGQFAARNWVFSNQGWHWRHRNPFIVIGWIGPLFWPFAYWDLVNYTYWPYAYDAFWPRAYDDLYVGMFGPYAYEGTPRSSRRTRASQQVSTIICSERVPAVTDWPIQEIARAIDSVVPVRMAAITAIFLKMRCCIAFTDGVDLWSA